jgi:hypothetical protein
MDAFPSVTIIAHVETKKDMDMFGPGSESREEKTMNSLQQMLDTGKTKGGRPLSAAELAEVKAILARRAPVMEELKQVKFQSATLTFDHDFSIDLGNREVVYPIPYIYDGYPSEWIQTLQNLAQLDANTVVPGHGPAMHDKTYIFLVRDLLKSTLDQMNTYLARTGPAMFRTLDEVKGAVDLSPFRQRFAGTDKDQDAAFDDMANNLIKVTFEEASLR